MCDVDTLDSLYAHVAAAAAADIYAICIVTVIPVIFAKIIAGIVVITVHHQIAFTPSVCGTRHTCKQTDTCTQRERERYVPLFRRIKEVAMQGFGAGIT